MNFHKLSQQSEFFEEEVGQQCQLCRHYDMAPVIANALFYKHATPQDHLYTKHIDDILQNACSSQVIMYNQQNFQDESIERMRRMYGNEQWETKIGMLSEYYKFHRDIPLIFDLGVSKIQARYFDKLKKYDYKQIKKVLRQQKIRNGQQYSSITSIDNSSSLNMNSDVEIKSKYSNLLNSQYQLSENNHQMEQSKLLLDMCEQIGQAFDRQYSPLKLKKTSMLGGKMDLQNEKFQKYVQNNALQRSGSFKKKHIFNFGKEGQKIGNKPIKNFDLNYDKFRRAGTENRKSVQQFTKSSNLAFLKRSRKQARQVNNRNFNKVIKDINRPRGEKVIANTASKNNSRTAVKVSNLQLYIPKASLINTITSSANNSMAGGIKLTINANTGSNLNVNIFNNNFVKKEGLSTNQTTMNNQFKTRRSTIQSINANELLGKKSKSSAKFKTLEQIYKPSQYRNSSNRNSITNLLVTNNRSRSVINLIASRRESFSANKRNAAAISGKQLSKIKRNTQSGTKIGLNRHQEVNTNVNGFIGDSQSNNLSRKFLKSHSLYDKAFKRDLYSKIKQQQVKFGNLNARQIDDNCMDTKNCKKSGLNSKYKVSKMTIEQLLKDKLINQAVNFHSGYKNIKN